MSTAVWKLIPKKQIGEIEFGADKNDVRKVLGKEYRPFRKSIFAKSTTDAYADYHVYYTKEGALVANETSAEYTYEVEMLNGGVWVETLSDAGVATFANGNFTFDVPVNTDTNSVAIRITITATTATSGSVSSVIVVAAQ